MSLCIDHEKLLAYGKKALFYYDLPGLAFSAGTLTGEDEKEARVCRAALGFQDLPSGRPLKEEHIFHMASVTKLFVGTAILQLWERGLLSPGDFLTKHLPDFSMADPRYRDVTLGLLLSHTAGMPDVSDYHWDAPETDEGALLRYVLSPEVKESRLLWAPGRGGFAYSNMGYEALGAVIAAVSGLSFEDYIEENIFRPLGMGNSGLLTFHRDMSSVATPHIKDSENHIVPAPHFPYNRAHGPSSTLTSDLADMEKWAAAHLRQELLKPDSYAAAWTPVATVPNNGEEICLSWFRRKQEGLVLYGHEGTDDGFRASFWICPELKTWVVVCSNLSAAPVKKINKELFRLLLG
ncbi:MAG: serine hydrolase domain-containing protein [Bacillota bacterium]|nr:serine hydrolase domain-containing protein [Bacillota bacterium]